MAITSAQILARFPELADVTNAQWADILTDVYNELDAGAWESRLDLGAKWLAAHYGKLAILRGSSGAVQSESAGGVSRSYQAARLTATPDLLETTTYGREFTRLVMQLPLARLTVA